ncbi:MAG: sulfatase-like hydrolase/transferase [Saprospiraceae bacterium]|nr:sulfatase-like hydrolase/transferase [Saprospiraceae bacterium]
MWRLASYLLRLLIYYLALFAVLRGFFLFDAGKYISSVSLTEKFRCFSSAIKLDLAAAAYFVTFTLLLVFIAVLTRKAWINKVITFFHLTMTLIYSGLAIGENLLYREWQAKVGYESLKHFVNISEVMKTPSFAMISYFLLGTGITFIIFRWIYNKWVATSLHFPEYKRTTGFYAAVIPLYLALTAGSVITMRGGLGRFPISVGVSYYSSNSTLNDAATNVFWHAIYSLLNTSEYKRLQPFIDNPEPGPDFFDNYQSTKDTFPSILNTDKPNIVFFILESWSADVCNQEGRDSLIAPFFNGLIRQGLYFSDCYASGHVSDQGVPAALGALPVIPSFSLLMGKQQVGELPCITDDLKADGYYTGFLYGGQLDYGNIRGYVFKKGFDEVADVQYFPSSTPKTALGVPDLPLYMELLSKLNSARQPFFYCGYNISTHSPYDVPVDYGLGIGGENAAFINTIHYGDSSLGVFFKEAKKQPWFDNTLFVFVADHSHESQIIRVREDKDRYRIPLLLYGPVLKPEFCGMDIHKVVSQLDLTGLLLSQLGLEYRGKYPFTRNPLQSNFKEMAFYNFPGGSGIVTPNSWLTRNLNDPKERERIGSDTLKAALYGDIGRYLHKASIYLRDR